MYTFGAKPQPVAPTGKYRDNTTTENGNEAINIMFDKRVVRGSNYGKSNNDKEHTLHNTAIVSRNKKVKTVTKTKTNIFDIRPVPKGQRMVDLSEYLIKKEETKILKTASTITDSFIPKDENADKFIAKKTGVDASTQIDKTDRLFDFNKEVSPIVDVLAYKTLEQAMMEVEEEEEMKELHNARVQYIEDERRERGRIRRMEEAEIQRYKEKEEQLARSEEIRKRQLQVLDKMDAIHISNDIISSLKDKVIKKLEDENYFKDPVSEEIRLEFFPWLLDTTIEEIKLRSLSQEIVQKLLENSIKVGNEREEQLSKSREISKTQVRLFVRGLGLDANEETAVGPIDVGPQDTILEVEKKILQWLRDKFGESFTPPPEGFFRVSHDGKMLDEEVTVHDAHVENNATLELINIE